MKYKLLHPKPVELRMMTPMIDVIFLLLVFFVCTSNFTPPEAVLQMESTFPGDTAAEMVLPNPVNLDTVLIQIFFEHEVHWQIEWNQCSSLRDAQSILRLIWDVKPDTPVIIESADNVTMEHVIDIYDVCRFVGLSRVQFSAR